VPKTTEELMEMGRFMIYANTTFMEEMNGEVARMIHQMVQLMNMRSLTQEHIDLNTKAVLWLQNIKPVFRQNSLVSSKQFCDLFSYFIVPFIIIIFMYLT
jgi:hypothetical protein